MQPEIKFRTATEGNIFVNDVIVKSNYKVKHLMCTCDVNTLLRIILLRNTFIMLLRD
jgi:hypothetical protein